MGVRNAAAARASTNRIGACTRGPSSRADSALLVNRGRNHFIRLLVDAASRPTAREV